MTKRPWLLSAAVALVTIALGVVAVLVLAPGDDTKDAAASPNHRAEKQSGKQTGASDVTTTTTGSALDPTTTTTQPAAAGAPAGTAATPGDAGADQSPVVPQFDQTDPPDPADAYELQVVPPGVSSTITSCIWSPANGGQLQASGALTNSANEDEGWLFSAVWLWRNVNQNEDFAQQNTNLHAAVGETAPWNLTTGAPTQPPNLSCALEID